MQLCCRRSRNSAGCHQLLHPRDNVHVLPDLRTRASVPEVPLVEETPYQPATGKQVLICYTEFA